MIFCENCQEKVVIVDFDVIGDRFICRKCGKEIKRGGDIDVTRNH